MARAARLLLGALLCGGKRRGGRGAGTSWSRTGGSSSFPSPASACPPLELSCPFLLFPLPFLLNPASASLCCFRSPLFMWMVGNLASLRLSEMRNGQSLLSSSTMMILQMRLNTALCWRSCSVGGGVPVPAWSGIWAAVRAPRAARWQGLGTASFKLCWNCAVRAPEPGWKRCHLGWTRCLLSWLKGQLRSRFGLAERSFEWSAGFSHRWTSVMREFFWHRQISSEVTQGCR